MRTHTAVTHSQANLTTQPALPLFDASPDASILSARNTTISDEDRYLCAWLRSRLDLATLTLQDDSALTVTPSDQRQIWRLLQQAKHRGLDLRAVAQQGRAA